MMCVHGEGLRSTGAVYRSVLVPSLSRPKVVSGATHALIWAAAEAGRLARQ